MRLQHTPNAPLQTAWPDAFEHDRVPQTVREDTFEHSKLLQTAWPDAFEHTKLLQTAIITLSGSTPKVFALLSSQTASQESVRAEGSFGSPSDGFWLDRSGTVHRAFLKSMQFLRGCFKIDAASPKLARRAELAWRLS